MSEWKQKRFWDAAHVVPCAGGHTVHLDNRPVKTPAKAALILPTAAMAQAIAMEWDTQTGKIDPRTMPVTRGANAAIDKVRIQRREVVDLLAEYGDSDLLCYRAVGPSELVDRQKQHWDPMIDWAAQALGTPLRVGEGVMHVEQAPDSLTRLHAALDSFDDFAMAALHDLISISGSLILALAVVRNALSADAAWALSRLDETWQAEQWGRDEDASANEAIKRDAFLDADRFYRLTLS